jgi:hypothetical protein
MYKRGGNMLLTILTAGIILFDTLQAQESIDLFPAAALEYFSEKPISDTNQFTRLRLFSLLSALTLTEDSLGVNTVKINSKSLEFVCNEQFLFIHFTRETTAEKFIQKILKNKGRYRDCYITNCLETMKTLTSFSNRDTVPKSMLNDLAKFLGISKEYKDYLSAT